MFLRPTRCCLVPSSKGVILSEAPRRSIASHRVYGAESKDPGNACWQVLFGAFRPLTTREIKKVTTSERSRPVPACRGAICFDESLGEQNQVPSVDRMRSNWQSVSSCVDERRARLQPCRNTRADEGFRVCVRARIFGQNQYDCVLISTQNQYEYCVIFEFSRRLFSP